MLWNRAYQSKVAKDRGARTIDLALCRPDGTTFRWSGRVLSPGGENDALTLRYIERHLKFLLWQKGGSRVLLAGAPEVATALSGIYSAD
ncbi:MAG: ROK family protein, partial [Verrucomicrobiae bacterium]|nr:ROK family protein [Verrucomicrobiae bacterium]